jgi:hypothetical protein
MTSDDVTSDDIDTNASHPTTEHPDPDVEREHEQTRKAAEEDAETEEGEPGTGPAASM